MIIEANSMHFSDLNQKVRQASEQKIIINNCIGQRYIASGLEQKQIELHGTPGNALGAYLNGGEITVFGNAQEATGDTMNDGKIVIHGSSGDATGYAMRGGKIFVRGNTGRNSPEGIPRKNPRNRNRRNGGELFGRISGRRQDYCSGPGRRWRRSGEKFLRNGHARRQNVFKGKHTAEKLAEAGLRCESH